jgi:hypothetical protein
MFSFAEQILLGKSVMNMGIKLYNYRSGGSLKDS